jgi:hypothetical protein
MNQLCRHIFPAGRHCTQPAVRTTLYCRHHQVIKRALAQVEPKPDPYGIYKPLPFVFPEDRAALQINFMLIAQALNDRSIHIQMANTFNRIFRSCEINLSRGPLTEPNTKRGKNSTQERGGAISSPSGVRMTRWTSRPKQSEVEGPATELSSRPERSEVEGPAVPQTSHEIKAGKNLDPCDEPYVPSVVKNAFPQPGPGAQSLTFTPAAARAENNFNQSCLPIKKREWDVTSQ